MARVLAVDGSSDDVARLQCDLEKAGHDVLTADSVEETLDALQKMLPDLVLLDIKMLGSSDVFALMEADEKTKNIPVILLSTHVLSDEIIDGLSHGIQGKGGCVYYDYIVKPYQWSVLMARVGSALRLKSMQDELSIAYARLKEMTHMLDQLSTVDALTTLMNRRHFFERATTELDRAWRYKSEVSFLIIDIDYFKAINDQYGYCGGDRVLKQVAKSVLDVTRAVDLVGRVGGEEFAVCCPRVSVDEVMLLGERICTAVAALTVEFADHLIPVTVSIGATEITAQDHGISDLLRRADAALYQAKGHGRNCVMKMTAQTMN
jgi:diguanylate cyclase (GGDEF)-like protein